MMETTVNKKNLLWMPILVTALFFALRPGNAWADGVSVNVSVNTSGLASSPHSEIIFVLTDGSGLGDGNNTAALSNFAFGKGGSAGPVDAANTGGGATGDLTSGASLTDSAFTNTFAAFFTAGTQLSFVLNLTTNVDAGTTPDQFSFLILAPSGNPIPSSDPTGFDNLVSINLDSANPTIQSYSGLVKVTPVGTLPTPEPSTALLFGLGLLVLALKLVKA
jgi:hypothetical protein